MGWAINISIYPTDHDDRAKLKTSHARLRRPERGKTARKDSDLYNVKWPLTLLNAHFVNATGISWTNILWKKISLQLMKKFKLIIAFS